MLILIHKFRGVVPIPVSRSLSTGLLSPSAVCGAWYPRRRWKAAGCLLEFLVSPAWRVHSHLLFVIGSVNGHIPEQVMLMQTIDLPSSVSGAMA